METRSVGQTSRTTTRGARRVETTATWQDARHRVEAGGDRRTETGRPRGMETRSIWQASRTTAGGARRVETAATRQGARRRVEAGRSPAGASARATSSARPTWAEALMVAHVVLFKPKADLSGEVRQRLVDAFSRALREIPSIRRAHIGRRVTHGRSYEQLMTVDYQYAAIMEFDTVADLKAYLAHEAHDALGTLFFDAFDIALMYDYEMEPDATAFAVSQ